MERTKVEILGALIMIVIAQTAWAQTTWNVPGDFVTIQAAHDGAAPGDIIDIAPGTYFEQLVMTKPLTLRGGGAGATVLDGQMVAPPASSFGGIITIRSVDFTLADMTLTNGLAANGGAVRIGGGHLTVIRCVISNSAAMTRGGGGIAVVAGGATLISSTLIGNEALIQGGGLWLLFGTSLLLRDTLVTENTAPQGSAVFEGSLGPIPVEIIDSRIDFNSGTPALRSVGAVRVINSSVDDNSGSGVEIPAGFGGLALHNSSVSRNSKGVTARGDLEIIDSMIDGNNGTGLDFAGSSNGTVAGATVSNNGNSGLIASGSGELRVENSTISGNIGVQAGGLLAARPVDLNNVTVSGNHAGFGGGGGGIQSQSLVTITNTIVSGNTAEGGSPDCGGDVTSNGHNLIGDISGCDVVPDVTDLIDVDPLLGILADNGGRTWTHALQEGSPAIDAGDDSVCPATDQRGMPRAFGPCDIGAYEADAVRDTDDDGIPDEEDVCILSDLTPTVVIDGCDSGAPNLLLEDGCTVSDLIAQLGGSASNHGQFVSDVSHLVNGLKTQGLFSGSQKGAIQSCAARSSIP